MAQGKADSFGLVVDTRPSFISFDESLSMAVHLGKKVKALIAEVRATAVENGP